MATYRSMVNRGVGSSVRRSAVRGPRATRGIRGQVSPRPPRPNRGRVRGVRAGSIRGTRSVGRSRISRVSNVRGGQNLAIKALTGKGNLLSRNHSQMPVADDIKYTATKYQQEWTKGGHDMMGFTIPGIGRYIKGI